MLETLVRQDSIVEVRVLVVVRVVSGGGGRVGKWDGQRRTCE